MEVSIEAWETESDCVYVLMKTRQFLGKYLCDIHTSIRPKRAKEKKRKEKKKTSASQPLNTSPVARRTNKKHLPSAYNTLNLSTQPVEHVCSGNIRPKRLPTPFPTKEKWKASLCTFSNSFDDAVDGVKMGIPSHPPHSRTWRKISCRRSNSILVRRVNSLG